MEPSLSTEIVPNTSSSQPPQGIFSSPQFVAELVELQAAERGRKFASKDRRPLDPPPIVLLRIYRETVDPISGSVAKEEVLDYDTPNIQGCMCSVELYRTTPGVGGIDGEAGPSSAQPSNVALSGSVEVSKSSVAVLAEQVGPTSFTQVTAHEFAQFEVTRGVDPSVDGTDATLDGLHSPPVMTPSTPDGTAAGENNCTPELFGSSVVQVRPVKYNGRSALFFVFGDLAVRSEGWFSLRYRFFDLFSKRPGEPKTSILAECTGKAFRVYPSKEFPGLKASTSLTMLAVKHGISVHVRQKERKRRKRESPSGDDE